MFLKNSDTPEQLAYVFKNTNKKLEIGSVLQKAIDNEDISAVRILLNSPYAKLSEFGRFVFLATALKHNGMKGNEIYKILINDSRFSLENRLCAAASVGNVNMVKELLEQFDFSYEDKSLALIKSTSNTDSVQIALLLLSNDYGLPADPAFQNNNAIVYASGNGNIELVKLLLSYPEVNPSAQNNNALRQAINKSDMDMINLLLNDSRTDYPNILIHAVQIGNPEIVKMLLNNPKVDASVKGNKAIKNVVEALEGDLRVLNLLIDGDPDGESVEEDSREEISEDGIEKATEYHRNRINKYTTIVAMLLNDKNVWNKLSEEDRMKYSGLLGG